MNPDSDNIPTLAAAMLDGDRRALARLLTLVERGGGHTPAVARAVHHRAGRAHVVGVTGPPGAGKSSLVDALVALLRAEDRSAAVLAVDPSSPFTGGAVLGDRVRMQRHGLDHHVFIRSMAARRSHGGLAEAASAAVMLLDAFGFDYVLIETVGVGQTELDVAAAADTVAVVTVPEAGDAIQAIKAGLIEIAHVFVVNKRDRPGSQKMAATLRAALDLAPPVVKADRRPGAAPATHAPPAPGAAPADHAPPAPGAAPADHAPPAPGAHGWNVPVLLTRADTGDGVHELRRALSDHLAALAHTPGLPAVRRERRVREFETLTAAAARARLDHHMRRDPSIHRAAQKVASGNLDPYTAAQQTAAALPLPNPSSPSPSLPHPPHPPHPPNPPNSPSPILPILPPQS